jgi:hypothetical protein
MHSLTYTSKMRTLDSMARTCTTNGRHQDHYPDTKMDGGRQTTGNIDTLLWSHSDDHHSRTNNYTGVVVFFCHLLMFLRREKRIKEESRYESESPLFCHLYWGRVLPMGYLCHLHWVRWSPHSNSRLLLYRGVPVAGWRVEPGYRVNTSVRA